MVDILLEATSYASCADCPHATKFYPLPFRCMKKKDRVLKTDFCLARAIPNINQIPEWCPVK